MAGSVNCREASRLLSAACDRALDREEQQALEYHLGRCAMCRDFESQLKILRRAAERFRAGGA